MAIDLINDFVKDTPDFNKYSSDLKTQSAVERQLAIVGEAINKLKQAEPDVTIQNGKQIIAFRNRLVHAYDSIANSIVWVILKNHIPPFELEIKALLP